MNDLAAVIGQLAFILLTVVGGSCLGVTAAAIMPERVERCGEALAGRPLLSLLAGLLVAVPALLLVLSVWERLSEAHRFLAMIPLSLLLLLSVPGLAAMSCAIGRRLGGEGLHPAAAALRGAPVLACAAATPIPGWFVVLPLALAAGLGSLLVRARR